MKKINIAIIGYGFMGKVYNYAVNSINNFYADIPKVEITSILVSKNKTKLEIEKIKRRYGFKTITTDINLLLNDDEINAFYIATPNDSHYKYVKLAIENKKHVLCEKPMGLSTKETKEMLTLAEDNPSLITNMVFEYRYIPALYQIKELIQKSKLGEILQFRAMYLHGSYIDHRDKTWRLKKGTGGSLVDLGPHLFDLINYLLGPFSINSYKKSIKREEREVDDAAWFLCETENNADGYIEVSRVSTGSVDDLRLEIHGTKGAIKWNLESLNYFSYFKKDDKSEGFKLIPCYNNQYDNSDFPPPKVSNGWMMAHIHCLYNFVKEISDNNFEDKRTAKFKDGHYVQSIIQNIK